MHSNMQANTNKDLNKLFNLLLDAQVNSLIALQIAFVNLLFLVCSFPVVEPGSGCRIQVLIHQSSKH